MIELEPRNLPAPLIPGWDGPEQLAYGNFDNDNFVDRAVVAQVGGSVRVMVFRNPHNHDGEFNAYDPWPVMLNTIVFDPNFRGGGSIAVVPYSLNADFIVPAALLVVPGPGGGPVVARFDFATGDRFDFFAPYDTNFRGGLWISTGDIDDDREPEALFLPGDGGTPRLVAVDMRTYETEVSIFVGDPQDTSGLARFESGRGTIHHGPDLFFYIQYGDVVDNRADSALIPVPRR